MGLEFSFMFWPVVSNLGVFCPSELECEFNLILWTMYREVSVSQGLGAWTSEPKLLGSKPSKLQDLLAVTEGINIPESLCGLFLSSVTWTLL